MNLTEEEQSAVRLGARMYAGVLYHRGQTPVFLAQLQDDGTLVALRQLGEMYIGSNPETDRIALEISGVRLKVRRITPPADWAIMSMVSSK